MPLSLNATALVAFIILLCTSAFSLSQLGISLPNVRKAIVVVLLHVTSLVLVVNASEVEGLEVLFIAAFAANSTTDFYSRHVFRPVFAVAMALGVLSVAASEMPSAQTAYMAIVFLFFSTMIFRMTSVDDIALIAAALYVMLSPELSFLLFVGLFILLSGVLTAAAHQLNKKGSRVEIAFLPIIYLVLITCLLI